MPISPASSSGIRPDNMGRNDSIDSSASSLSAATNISRANVYRTSTEAAGPQDVASIVASAGSAEAAIKKLLNEKNSAASHNAQLWRLVEKQRSMIMDLNKDLEKSLKDKERYRKKLKDHLVSSSSAPLLTSARQSSQDVGTPIDRKMSESPAFEPRVAAHPVMRDISIDSRKVSESSESASVGPRRSDTPQDAMNIPGSASTVPTTPPSVKNLPNIVSARHDLAQMNGLGPYDAAYSEAVAAIQANSTETTPPISPSGSSDTAAKTPQQTYQSATPTYSAVSPPASAASFGGFKTAARKAPPAPLDLSPRPLETPPQNVFPDDSESEYENEPDSARQEQTARGRRKTREEDDREREQLARQAEEEIARSRSKKEKSKSKSQQRTEPTVQPEDFPLHNAAPQQIEQPAPRMQQPDMSQPANILRQRVASNATQAAAQTASQTASQTIPRMATAPALMSPGLPMSPRPGDRPMNSPMPRAPNKNTVAMPMSPRAGMPLSPRPPRQPITLPNHNQTGFASPHVARAEQYQSLSAASSTQPDEIGERSPSVASPTEIYRGLVTEQYPDFLLPPNALPLIVVKTASSRMRPSRQSYIAPRLSDENPVFIIGVYQRSDSKQLWQAEKTTSSLAQLDQFVKMNSIFRDKLPDRSLFAGHAPAKIDARRVALDQYFERMLDSIQDEKTARILCKFLSTDALPAEVGEAPPVVNEPASVSDPAVSKGRPRREGYLTKRGKNFGGWKARYFVLDGPALKYFEAPGGAQLGSIKLQNAQIGKQSPATNQQTVEDEENQFRHAFLVLEPKRKDSTSLVRHVLCAESDDERDLWVEALLQYVDYDEKNEQMGGGVPIAANGPRSPRLQKSQSELRPSSQTDSNSLRPGDARGYDSMVAGDAPTIGGTARSNATPPPRQQDEGHPHPQISGPSNAQLIQNTENWGMKPPPTPNTLSKDKKRGLFNFRGRSSSDLNPSEQPRTPGMPPDGHDFPRMVFGIPLAEAASYSRPLGVNTELPIVVYRCLEYLQQKDVTNEEGIFRLSGSNTVIKKLRDRFNNEGDVNLAGEGEYYDIHAVASLLKLYLRELPASILTRELHLDFLSCLEMSEQDKINGLNVMVNRLPPPNRVLLSTLSDFLLAIVSNADVNKMNIRNVGIVFSPTLNVPAPLISSLVENQSEIFGDPVDEASSPIVTERTVQLPVAGDLRSPRKQMFSDLPTPAYNQTQFQSFGAIQGNAAPGDTGMIPMHPTYSMAPQGDGGYGSLNDALRSPAAQSFGGGGLSVPKDVKSKRRESSMMGMMGNNVRKNSPLSGVGEEGDKF